MPILSLSNLVASIIGGVITITAQKFSLRWGKMAQIQKDQFDQFIKPAFNIFRQILDPGIEYNIIEVPQGNEAAKSLSIEQLKTLAKDQREYLDDLLYRAIIYMPEKTSAEIDEEIKLIGTEIARLYFLKREEVKIKSRLPDKKRIQIALSFGQGESKAIARKFWMIKIVALLDVVTPYLILLVFTILIIYGAAATWYLWRYHFFLF